jgi:hypothetical protein
MTEYEVDLIIAEEKLFELSEELEKDPINLEKIEAIKQDYIKSINKVIDHVEFPNASVTQDVVKRTWVAVLTYTNLRQLIFIKTKQL